MKKQLIANVVSVLSNLHNSEGRQSKRQAVRTEKEENSE